MGRGWRRLNGGPCDGDPVWAAPDCLDVVVTRDSDRQPWFRHLVQMETQPVFMAAEVHRYRQEDDGGSFVHDPGGLERVFEGNQPVWQLRGRS